MFEITCLNCKKKFHELIYNKIEACSWPCFTAIFEPIAAAARKQRENNAERGIIEKKARAKKDNS